MPGCGLERGWFQVSRGPGPGRRSPGLGLRGECSDSRIDPDRHEGSDGDSRIGALPIRDAIPPFKSMESSRAATRRQRVASLLPLCCCDRLRLHHRKRRDAEVNMIHLING